MTIIAAGGMDTMPHVEIGHAVPDFRLPDANGKEIALSSFRGNKVVIYFYPQDDTPTCTQESCDFRDAHPKFEAVDAVVIGISPDPPKSHAKFIQKFELPFVLLSDSDRKICEMFGVWTLKKMYGREYMGVERSTFLIDEQGILRGEWRKVRVKGHVEKVLEAVRSL